MKGICFSIVHVSENSGTAKAFSNGQQLHCTFVIEYNVTLKMYLCYFKNVFTKSLVIQRNDFDRVVIF